MKHLISKVFRFGNLPPVMIHAKQLPAFLKEHRHGFCRVVPFNPAEDKLLLLDFTERNKELTDDLLNDINRFSDYIHYKLEKGKCKYGIGGYAEHRTVYKSSSHFDSPGGEEPRRLHLGIDIWGPAGTPVMAPLNGTVHSFAFNDHHGDYGGTIILSHNVEGNTFYTLYGHLGIGSLHNLHQGQLINAGDIFGSFGNQNENGHWPPHLHFQLIIDMHNKKGDYPGVCKYNEREKYLANSPDPDVILGMMKYAGIAG